MKITNHFLLIALLLTITTIANAQWTQIGADIDAEASADFSGYSVSLSSDGSVVAIGAYGNDANGSNAGHVRIYENVSGTWPQIGVDIDGEVAEDKSGISVSLSSDGSVVAIGAYTNEGNGSYAGHVRVYEYILAVTSHTPITDEIDIAVNENIQVVFSEDINAITINTSNFQAVGSSSGLIAGVFDIVTNTVTLDPTSDFVNGKIITVKMMYGLHQMIWIFRNMSYE